MVKILTIAGSDSSGGAGIQTDLKTIAAHGAYGMSVITALTAQNTLGVRSIQGVTPEMVRDQLDCVFEDIRPDAVKIGMVGQADVIMAIAEGLRYHRAPSVVVDPVMVSTSGSRLLAQEALEALTTHLLPMAALITPNIPEAEVLWGRKITDRTEMEQAASDLAARFGCPVLLKGGHGRNTANDLLCVGESLRWIEGVRINNPNTHGTGCTLSSAIACNLGSGMGLEESVRAAKDYLTGALKAMLDLGQGSGPLDHGWQHPRRRAEKL